MKVRDWTRKMRTALFVSCLWIPGMAFAQDIPLGDPSFEDFVVPANVGYAYSDTYRPTSAWVDDLDSPGNGFYYEDDGNSNWLYDSNYAESDAVVRRAAPRTGNQAMHGIGYYNAQEAGAVFEANKTYTFSVWAQGDADADGATSRVWLYIFDGSVAFSEDNSLIFARYAPDNGDFENRTMEMTQEESQANWTQISISWTVKEGAPEIGNPIGVGFWIAGDGGIDDATLAIEEGTTVVADAFTVFRGFQIGGTLEDSFESDDSRLRFNPGFVLNSAEAPVWLIFDGTLPTDSPGSLAIVMESQAGTPGLTGTIEAWNWITGSYDVVDVTDTSFNNDTVVSVDLTAGIGNYVQQGTGSVRTRVGWRKTGLTINFPWEVRLDQLVWEVD